MAITHETDFFQEIPHSGSVELELTLPSFVIFFPDVFVAKDFSFYCFIKFTTQNESVDFKFFNF